MKIIVCLKEIIDPTLSLGTGLRHRVVFNEGLPRVLNPDDTQALALALAIRSADEGNPIEITLVSIGPERVESYLRNGLALGADKALRIWGEDFEYLSSHQKAQLLSGAVKLLGADLVLTGCRSRDTGNSQVGPLIAAMLDFPCSIDVLGINPEEDSQHILVTRDIGRGEREKLRCPLPAVITVKGEGKLPCASLDRLIDSRSADISLLTLTDIGISSVELKNSPVEVTGLTYPQPRPKKVPTPDSSLPAFYRILKLLEGGISGRQGRMLEGTSDELADQLFEFLLAEGVIKSTRGS
jgi:electron transfer flavoprotein beta subunit